MPHDRVRTPAELHRQGHASPLTPIHEQRAILAHGRTVLETAAHPIAAAVTLGVQPFNINSSVDFSRRDSKAQRMVDICVVLSLRLKQNSITNLHLLGEKQQCIQMILNSNTSPRLCASAGNINPRAHSTAVQLIGKAEKWIAVACRLNRISRGTVSFLPAN